MPSARSRSLWPALVLLLCCPRASALVARLATDFSWNLLCSRSGAQELILGSDVALRQSPGKGTGVFALRPLRAGQLVVRYTGELRHREKHVAALESGITSGDYAFRLGSDWVVDGESPQQASWGRFINHSKRRANCEPVPAGARALASTFNRMMLLIPPSQHGKTGL